MAGETALTPQEPGTREMVSRPAPHHFSVMPKDLGEAMEIAKLLSTSSFIPTAFRGKPGDVLVVMMQAAELQIPYFAALHNTAVINGRPTIWGDLVTAIIQKSGKLEHCLREWDEETQTATCRIKRKGFPECIRSFSMADAKRAKLDTKDTYRLYPQRMCGWRAFSWAARDEFSDVLKGMSIAEEVLDYSPSSEPPTPISQPRPMAALVEGFLAPPAEEKRQVPVRRIEESATGEVVRVILAEVASQGKSKSGKPWTLYKITLEDGRQLASFSGSTFETAKHAAEQGSLMVITTSPGKKEGQLNLESIALAPVDEEGPEGGEGE